MSITHNYVYKISSLIFIIFFISFFHYTATASENVRDKKAVELEQKILPEIDKLLSKSDYRNVERVLAESIEYILENKLTHDCITYDVLSINYHLAIIEKRWRDLSNILFKYGNLNNVYSPKFNTLENCHLSSTYFRVGVRSYNTRDYSSVPYAMPSYIDKISTISHHTQTSLTALYASLFLIYDAEDKMDPAPEKFFNLKLLKEDVHQVLDDRIKAAYHERIGSSFLKLNSSDEAKQHFHKSMTYLNKLNSQYPDDNDLKNWIQRVTELENK